MKVAIAYKSYHNDPNTSHAGLGICAINSSKTLIQHGIASEVWGLITAKELGERLTKDASVTHVVIQAPWIPSDILYRLAQQFLQVQFAVNCHSNVGFLQTDPHGMSNMLDLLELEQVTNNIHAAGNSKDFSDWMSTAYQSPCTLLPNLYYLDSHASTHRPLWNGGPLRIGIFGAPRPQKNVMTGVAGSIQIAQMLKAHTEIWVNAGRNEGHGKTILKACQEAIARNPFTTYREFPWATWPQFRRFMGSMDLLVQVSYSESFNQVCADGIAMGVPTVISSAIRWAPSTWQADCDSAESVAHVGRALLLNPHASQQGLDALKAHNEWGIHQWKKYLKI